MNILESTFDVYQSLLGNIPVHLNVEEYALLTQLGLELVLQASGKYILKDIEVYHLPYQKNSFNNISEVVVKHITSSTLDITPSDYPCLVLAEAQTHSRGQYQRKWYSWLGKQILLTYHTDKRHKPFDGIWALWQVLREYDLRFKWPNDLYLNSLKVAGFLCQQSQNNSSISFGLNCSNPKTPPFGSLDLTPKIFVREILITRWLKFLEQTEHMTQHEIISDLRKISFFEEGQQVMHQNKIFNFDSISYCGAAVLLDPISKNFIKVVSGSLSKN